MSNLFPVETVLSWRWRRQANGEVISGVELRVAKGSEMILLTEYSLAEVDLEKLRCPRGERVIPLAPILSGRLL